MRIALWKTAGLAALLLGAAPAASATEPLHDRIWYQSRAGIVFDAATGPIALPPSSELRAMTLAESCSAVGGPRGVYKYISGKIWLIGLYRCGGDISLHEVYPGMMTSPVADWISGVVVARVGRILCTAPAGAPIFENEVSLTVEKGNVLSLVEKIHDASSCPPPPPLAR